MSASNEEIPGFYRDPETGQLCKDEGSNPFLEKLEKQRELKKIWSIKPNETNFVPFVNTRESNHCCNFSNQYQKMRCSSKEEVHSTIISELVSDDYCIDYLVGTENRLYSQWHYLGDDGKINYKLLSCDYSGPDLRVYPTDFRAIDMCEGLLDDTFVVVYNFLNPNLPLEPPELDITSTRMAGRFVESISDARRILADAHILHRPIFSCSSNQNRGLYAFGCEKAIAIRHPNEQMTLRKANGRVHAISFDPTGNLLAYGDGVDKGQFHVKDVRSGSVVIDETSHFPVIECSMSSFPNIILGGIDDCLYNLDARTKTFATEYQDHKQTTLLMSPVSVAGDMLCARGTDNVVRLWQLSLGGTPVHEIRPTEDHIKVQAWLYRTGSKIHLCVFEGPSKRIFDIKNI